MLPDLVNAHCHVELSGMRGALVRGKGFTEFAKGVIGCRGLMTKEAIREADQKMWQEGVGFVGDVLNTTASIEVKLESPINYTNFLELCGLGVEVGSLEGIIEELRRSGLRYGVTPHSTYSLYDKDFCDAVDFSGSAPLSIHFMEDKAETELFKGEGELYDWYCERGLSIDFGHYNSPAERVVACVSGDRDVLLIHNCFVSEEEVDLIENHFTGRVSWVVCPRSNSYITGAKPPIELLRRKGVKVAIGTDSLASNDSLSLIDELKMFEGVPLEELLSWVTVNGAEALGLSGVGAFEVGRKSGVVLLTGIDWQNMKLTEKSKTKRLI